MKSLFAFLTILVLPLYLAAHPEPVVVKTYTVDVTSSQVVWHGYKVTGAHHGTINLKSGSLTFTNNLLTDGQFAIDMNSIKNADMSVGGAEKLEGHLRSDDFFSVEKFPTASLVFTKVIPYGTTGDYNIYGDLTIKGKTHPIKFMAKVTDQGGVIKATAEITVDRSQYDVRYGSGSFFENLGDKAISDDFDLKVELTLNPA
jgi:polyisoprenoid-binding protein YceI